MVDDKRYADHMVYRIDSLWIQERAIGIQTEIKHGIHDFASFRKEVPDAEKGGDTANMKRQGFRQVKAHFEEIPGIQQHLLQDGQDQCAIAVPLSVCPDPVPVQDKRGQRGCKQQEINQVIHPERSDILCFLAPPVNQNFPTPLPNMNGKYIVAYCRKSLQWKPAINVKRDEFLHMCYNKVR